MDMEKVNLKYLMKNIPLPSKQADLQSMLEKTESFIKRLRWKAFFADDKIKQECTPTQSFGFPSERTPPQDEGLLAFELDCMNSFGPLNLKVEPADFKNSFP